MVNFGIIGCGKIGLRHIGFLKDNKNAEISAVSDLNEERAKNAIIGTYAKYYTDYKEMLKEDIDIINICLPNGLHSKIAIYCLNSGKHVLVEKPMALNVKDCREMIEAAKKNRKEIFVVKQNRFNKPIELIKDAIDKGNFGKIYMILCNVLWNRRPEYFDEERWRGTKDLDGGALFSQASHFVDIMQWFGGSVESVSAKMDKFVHNIETEDTGSVLIRFKNGCFGNINYTNCVYNKNMEGSLTVLGTKGTARIGGEYLNKIEHWNVEGYPLPSEIECEGSNRGHESKHNKVFDEVIKAIKNENSKYVNGEEGLKTVEIIEAAKISVETGKEVKLPL